MDSTTAEPETRSRIKTDIDRSDVMELLTALEIQMQRLGAVEQAAIDFITLQDQINKSIENEMRNNNFDMYTLNTPESLKDEIVSAYKHLRDLVS